VRAQIRSMRRPASSDRRRDKSCSSGAPEPDIDALPLPCSPGLATASEILTPCAETPKPVVVELGGKSANIVLEDADSNGACAFNTGAGQGCGLPTRMPVHESIHDEVVPLRPA
jgi:hypothetical protein